MSSKSLREYFKKFGYEEGKMAYDADKKEAELKKVRRNNRDGFVDKYDPEQKYPDYYEEMKKFSQEEQNHFDNVFPQTNQNMTTSDQTAALNASLGKKYTGYLYNENKVPDPSNVRTGAHVGQTSFLKKVKSALKSISAKKKKKSPVSQGARRYKKSKPRKSKSKGKRKYRKRC